MKMRNLVFLCTHGTLDKRAGNDQYLQPNDVSKIPPTFPLNYSPENSRDIEYNNRPNLERRESSDSQTSQTSGGIEMRITQDQDLGSDGESLPSGEESITTSESSPSSPQLFTKDKSRRESAPANLNHQALKGVETRAIVEEQTRESHRRYSSVEERTSRVRFNLEASFKEEEEKYNRQVIEQSEEDLQDKFKDLEDYQLYAAATTTQYPRKVSSPPCLSCDIEEGEQQQRKDINDRSRKYSVYSDHSGSIQVLPGQTIKRYSSKETLNKEEEKEKTFKRVPSIKRRQSKRNSKINDEGKDARKYSLQDYSSDRKSSCEQDTSRKFSLQIVKRKPSFSDRKLSLQEKNEKQKSSSSSSQTRNSYERSSSLSERKYSSPERKTSSQESRKTSLTETIRSVVSTKKKIDRKYSQEALADDNNNSLSDKDKKSAWGLIKNKIKKERKTSNDMIQAGSPHMQRLILRNDSGSSIDSCGLHRKYQRSDSQGKRSSRYEDSDRKSISSFNSVDTDDQDSQRETVPRCPFDLWSEGKVGIDTDSPTLPLLHVAAGEGNVDLLQTLLDVGVDINEKDQCGWPALHYAICSGHFECAQLLMEKGAALANYSNKVMNFYCTAVRDCIRTSNPYH